jgi:hypothetical protein
LLLFLVSFAAFANPGATSIDAEEKACAEKYSSWYRVLAKNACVREIRRREIARVCIKKDFPRMKSEAAEVKAGLEAIRHLDEAKKALETIMKRGIFIEKASDDPQDQIIGQVIPVNCDSQFHLAMLLRAGPSGALKHLKTWLRSSPPGYPSGLMQQYAIDYATIDQRLALERKRRAEKAATARKRMAIKARRNAAKRRIQAAARQRRQTEAAREAKAEAQRKRADREVARKRLAFAPPYPMKDHCAPGLTRNERIRRLSRHGSVRQTRPGTFRAGRHGVRFATKQKGPAFCN